MALRLFQSWALAFKPKQELSFFVDVYNELKNSGELLCNYIAEAHVQAFLSHHHQRRPRRIFSIPRQRLHGWIRMCACDVEPLSHSPTGNTIAGIVVWSLIRLAPAKPCLCLDTESRRRCESVKDAGRNQGKGHLKYPQGASK